MSAIPAALSQIDRVAAERDLAPKPTAPLELEAVGEPIVLPDGKRIYPPTRAPGDGAQAYCLHSCRSTKASSAWSCRSTPSSTSTPTG